MDVNAPRAPGRLGQSVPAEELLGYVQKLELWLHQRNTELEHLRAALAQSDTNLDFDTDLTLAVGLWHTCYTHLEKMKSVWQSHRPLDVLQETVTSQIWGRLDDGIGAGTLSLVEVVLLTDALIDHLREQLGLDPNKSAQIARRHVLASTLVRCEGMLAYAPDHGSRIAELRHHLDLLAADLDRGADVEGRLNELETQLAASERDLIIRVSTDRQVRADIRKAKALFAELSQTEATVREVVEQTRAQIVGPPRLALPNVSNLGEPPTERDPLLAYLNRLDRVGRALEQVRAAYLAPLQQRAALQEQWQLIQQRSQTSARHHSPTAVAAAQEAAEALESIPCDLTLCTALVEQFDLVTRELPRSTVVLEGNES